MRLDRKLLLIAPAIVLSFVVAGLIYTTVQLHVLGSVSDSFTERSAFIGAVVRGEKALNPRQAVGLLQLGLDVEARRTAAIHAAEELLIVLAAIAAAAVAVLAVGIRGVPREHWPRFGGARKTDRAMPDTQRTGAGDAQ